MTAVIGVILAGGSSRRFGGDKALARMTDGRTMLEHVAERLRTVCARVVMVVDRAGRYAAVVPGIEAFVDDARGLGPAAALGTALRHANTPVLCAPCDMPALSPALLRLLLASRGEHDAVACRLGDALEPFPGVYERSCLPFIERRVRERELAFHDLLGVLNVNVIGEETWRAADPDGSSFLNVNTPADLPAGRRGAR